MKLYQVAILFFAIGIFSVTSLGLYFLKKNDIVNDQSVLSQVEYKTVQVFFANETKDPNLINCDVTYPVDRSISRLSDNKKSALAEYIYLAVIELLKGPGEADKTNGYISAINEGTKVQGIIIEKGVATVDFNAKLNEGIAGSCKVQIIHSQITETLKQFPEIKEVKITINGKDEGILQP